MQVAQGLVQGRHLLHAKVMLRGQLPHATMKYQGVVLHHRGQHPHVATFRRVLARESLEHLCAAGRLSAGRLSAGHQPLLSKAMEVTAAAFLGKLHTATPFSASNAVIAAAR